MLWKRILALGLAAGIWAGLSTGQEQVPLEALEARIARLEGDITSLESVRAIKRLQYAYGHYVEFGLWNDFADLFTEDAVTNYQQGARGKEQVRRLFFDQVGQGKLGLADGRIYPHILFQPVITLAPDGHTAKGRWRILAMLGGFGGSATWYSGVYENEYVLEDGVWKISLLRSEPKATAAYSAPGWKDSGTHVPFHYTARSVGAPIPNSAGRTASAANGAPPSLAALASHVQQLAERAARLDDQSEVTNLQDSYGYAIDHQVWKQAADLFAENGTLELGLRGIYVGQARIRKALETFGSQGAGEAPLNDHVYLQTLVSVSADRRTANARGVELIFSNSVDGGLEEGVFENTFDKQNGAWKIQSVHFYPRMIVDAKEGWAKSARPTPGPSKEFPPDRPPATIHEIYPKFAVAPFHFDNPVTGKPPQYPAGVPADARPGNSTAPIPSEPAIRKPADLRARLVQLERSVRRAEAFDAAENLIGAYGYYLDETSSDLAGLFAKPPRTPTPERPVFVNQILQPVIDVAGDGKSAKVRARFLDLRGTSGGPGFWNAGTFEGRIFSADGVWRFESAQSTPTWTASYPGGWVEAR